MKQKIVKVMHILTTVLNIAVIALGVLNIIFDDVAILEYLFPAAIILTVICSIVNAILVKKKSYAITVSVVGIILIISTIIAFLIPSSPSALMNMIFDVGILILLIANTKSEKS